MVSVLKCCEIFCSIFLNLIFKGIKNNKINCSFLEEGKWKDFSFPLLMHVYKDSTRISYW